jgi:hypothetical protein
MNHAAAGGSGYRGSFHEGIPDGPDFHGVRRQAGTHNSQMLHFPGRRSSISGRLIVGAG